MKRLKKIQAAEATSAEERLDDKFGALQDTFEYVIAGLEHLRAQSAEAQQSAEILIDQIQEGLDGFVQRIADTISE